MKPILIQFYALKWDPKNNTGMISLTVGGPQPVVVPVNSAAEFTAIAAVLNQAPVYLFPDGAIGTAWEPAKD